MTTYSSAEFATYVLRGLALYAPDESPSAEDLADTLVIIASEIASMAVRGIALPNASDQAVPLEALSPWVRRLGLAVGPHFGVMTMAEAALAIPAAELYLREMSAKQPTGAVAEAEYL